MGTISVQNLGKAYKQYPSRWSRLAEWMIPFSKPRHKMKWVLQDLNFTIQAGEAVGIVGINGAGKSTLLHILGTLDTADAGTICINNTEVHTLSKNEMADFRNQSIGFVFQFHHLLPEFNALENICMPQWIAKKDKIQAERYALELLDYMHLADKAHKKPNELSGGEQQRIAIARALINKPAILFADEPTGNLDSHNAQSIHELFSKLRTELQQTFVIVTHNEDLAKSTDRIIKMQDGLIIA